MPYILYRKYVEAAGGHRIEETYKPLSIENDTVYILYRNYYIENTIQVLFYSRRWRKEKNRRASLVFFGKKKDALGISQNALIYYTEINYI